MRIIVINRRLLKAIILMIILSAIGFISRSIIIHEGLLEGRVQMDNECLTAFLTTPSSNNEGYIEVFDIGKGSVIKKIQSDKVITNEAKNYLEGIQGMYEKVKAFPDKGLIVKIPFDTMTVVKSKWLNDYGIKYVDKVFVLFPEDGKPFLLVLDSKERPYFYNFNGNTEKLLKYLE